MRDNYDNYFQVFDCSEHPEQNELQKHLSEFEFDEYDKRKNKIFYSNFVNRIKSYINPEFDYGELKQLFDDNLPSSINKKRRRSLPLKKYKLRDFKFMLREHALKKENEQLKKSLKSIFLKNLDLSRKLSREKEEKEEKEQKIKELLQKEQEKKEINDSTNKSTINCSNSCIKNKSSFIGLSRINEVNIQYLKLEKNIPCDEFIQNNCFINNNLI